MAVDPRKKFKFKIHPRDMEEIVGEYTDFDDKFYDEYFRFRFQLDDLYMILNKEGRLINPDGYAYFNDPDELIFPKATEESKKELRKQIIKNMIPASQKVD